MPRIKAEKEEDYEDEEEEEEEEEEANEGPTRRTKKQREDLKIITVRVGRLGSAVETFQIEKGSTVQELLDTAHIDGATTTVKIDGKVTKADSKLTKNNVLICAIPEVKAQ